MAILIRTLKARLSAATDVLNEWTVGSVTHTRVSTIQANAVLALLRSKDAKQLDAEEKANIMDTVVAMNWVREDSDKILAEMTNTPLSRRRANQNFTAFISYATK